MRQTEWFTENKKGILNKNSQKMNNFMEELCNIKLWRKDFNGILCFYTLVKYLEAPITKFMNYYEFYINYLI